jgi:hypothetical protein
MTAITKKHALTDRADSCNTNIAPCGFQAHSDAAFAIDPRHVTCTKCATFVHRAGSTTLWLAATNTADYAPITAQIWAALSVNAAEVERDEAERRFIKAAANVADCKRLVKKLGADKPATQAAWDKQLHR